MKRIGVAVLALAAAQPAAASDKEDFAQCDGRIHPGKQDDGMRGEASVPSYGFGRFGMPNLAALGIPAPSGPRVAACTRALESPRLLPGQSLRRAHLLRARAAGQIQAGKTAEALADLDLADAAVSDRQGDRFYQRSMGASILLLRALAKIQAGDLPAAEALARSALAARPYALRIQSAAAAIIQAARSVGAASPSPWAQIVRLEPQAARQALVAEAEAGNWAEVLKLRPLVTTDWTPGQPTTLIQLFNPALSALVIDVHTANARIGTGDLAGARDDLAKLKARMAAQKADAEAAAAARAAAAAAKAAAAAATAPAADGATKPAAPDGAAAVTAPLVKEPPRPDPLQSFAEQRIRQLEARLALAERRPAEAADLAGGGPLPADAASLALLDALAAAPPAKAGAKPVDPAPLRAAIEGNRRRDLRALAGDVLIAPETPRSVIDYEKSRPNILGALVNGALTMGFGLLQGVDRKDGFRSTANPDGSTKVEFTGNTPSEPLVQEMTLLRAAELARTAGKWGFVIDSRADYTRMLVTTQYGVEQSRVPTGHKTELTVRFVDADADPARAFDAVALIDALGPFYYQDKAAKP